MLEDALLDNGWSRWLTPSSNSLPLNAAQLPGHLREYLLAVGGPVVAVLLVFRTHWTALYVLPYYGARVSSERVVRDGQLIATGGMTAGIDGALVMVALLRGDTVAQEIQLEIAYGPQPVFNAGSPATAPSEVLHTVQARAQAFRPTPRRRLGLSSPLISRAGLLRRLQAAPY